jgi:hypothetical protein
VDLDDLDSRRRARTYGTEVADVGMIAVSSSEESDLEEATEDGEISVGCRGCSLWLKVLFGVMEEEPAEKANYTLGDTGKGGAEEISSST